MSQQLQLRRGTAAQVAAFTGAQGEVAIDTTNNRLIVNDGATAGGWPTALATRTAVSDAAYAAAVTDRLIAYAALTAARTVTLPAAASFPIGAILVILDESGNCSATKTVAAARAGSDTINGGTSAAISTAYGVLALESDGSNAWTIVHSRATATARTPVSDAAYAALATDRMIAYVALTAARIVTLPAAAAYPTGALLVIIDESGSCSATKTITASRAGSDTINGATSAIVSAPYGYVALESNGSNAWTIADQASFTAGASPGELIYPGSVSIGTASSFAPLTVTSNASISQPPLSASFPTVYIAAVDGANTFVVMDAYSGGGSSNFHADLILRRARGTGASPTAAQAGDNLGQIQWRGYGATGFGAAKSAALEGVAAENWTDTAQGSYFSFTASPQGTLSPTEWLRIIGNGQVVFFGAQADQSKVDNTPTTGFSLTLGNSTTTLLLKPAGTLATGTVVLPAAPVDGQIARVLSSQTVSALTVSPSAGQSVSGAPSTVGPAAPFSMIYDLASTTWYRMS